MIVFVSHVFVLVGFNICSLYRYSLSLYATISNIRWDYDKTEGIAGCEYTTCASDAVVDQFSTCAFMQISLLQMALQSGHSKSIQE
jgi:hypothetical protein